MYDSQKKIVLATLILALGWGLSWPFRKTAEHANLSTTDRSKPSSWTDPVNVQKNLPTATSYTMNSQMAGTLAPRTPSTSTISQNKRSLSIADDDAHKIRQPHSINPSQRSELQPSNKSMLVSQTGLAPNASATGQRGTHASLLTGAASRMPSGLPNRMPGHYEPDYAFPAPLPPTPNGSTSSAEEMQPRPAYTTALGSLSSTEPSAPIWPQEIMHEIQNSDTLEKLAKRYLGDPARALDIFEFNRDKLKNPEILPIGAELRIPARR